MQLFSLKMTIQDNIECHFLICSALQLNKYQADLYLFELSHQMNNVCQSISDFLPTFDCSPMVGNIKLFCTSKNQNKNNSVFPTIREQLKVGKKSEINKQCHLAVQPSVKRIWQPS